MSAARIICIFGEQRGRRFEVQPSGVRLGTSASCEIMLRGTGISREHARIWKLGDAWLIEDLASTNGTFVDGERVKSRELDHRSTISLGQSVVLRFMIDRRSSAS